MHRRRSLPPSIAPTPSKNARNWCGVWQQRDPIKRLREELGDEGVTAEECDRIAATAEAAVDEALERAKGWPEPDLDSRLTDVYA